MTATDSAIRTRAWTSLILLVPAPSIGAAMMLWIAPGAVGTAVSGICKLWLLSLPVLWLLLVEKSKLQKPAVSWKGIVPGIATGVVIAIFMLGLFYNMAIDWVDREQVIAKVREAKLDSKLNYCLLFSFLILLNSLLEEYVWRWFVFRKCEELVTPLKAGYCQLCFLRFTTSSPCRSGFLGMQMQSGHWASSLEAVFGPGCICVIDPFGLDT